MIGLQTYSEEILKYLPQVGLTRNQVIVNPASTAGLKCIVSVGGPGVHLNHCYVQSGDSLPYIQCLDPSTVAAQPSNKVFILCALAKAKELMLKGYTAPLVDIKISPTMDDIHDFFRPMEESTLLSVDIETDPSTCELTTIGFAYRNWKDRVQAISIPFASENRSYWLPAEEAIIWQIVATRMSGNPKVMQNFIFDTMILSKYGIETTGPIYDTLTAAHWLSPELPKDLGTLGRLYLMCDAWKGQNSWVSNETLWEYNAKDAAYTLLILEKQKEAMRNDKRLEFFENQLTPLSIEVLRMCERGWTFNPKALAQLTSSLEVEAESLRTCLLTIAADFVRPRVKYMLRKGKPKIGTQYAIGLGPRKLTKTIQFDDYEDIPFPTELKQLKEYKLNGIQTSVFEKIISEHTFNPNAFRDVREVLIGLGVRIPMRDGRETVDETALLKLAEKLPPDTDDIGPRTFIDELLEYRGVAKLLSTYCRAVPDSDGKYRFSIVIPGTVEARFSSRQTPWGTGFNSQNIPKSFRHLSIPSKEDWAIVNMDFRAADPHMVAWLSGEKQMQAILESGGDLHAHTASAIYRRDITKEPGYKDSKERKLGKACNNGLNYGMQVFKFIETARKQGLYLSFDEAEAAFKAYFRLYPGIKSWQAGIKNQIDRTRTLITPFGRKRYFFGHLNDKTYNAALAWIPPSTVADALNAGWLKFLPAAQDLNVSVLQQCHDSLKLECPVSDVDAVAQTLIDSYKQVSFQIGGVERNLPVEIETGPNWGELVKWQNSSKNTASL